MKVIVFTSLQEALDNADLLLTQGKQKGIFSQNYAVPFCQPYKHPNANLWANQIDNYEAILTDQQISKVQELTHEWFAPAVILTTQDTTALIIETISSDPSDATITRNAVVKELPILFDIKELRLKVSIEHYREGQYIGSEKENKQVTLLADEAEFNQLYQYIIAGANMIELIKQFVHIRDGEGRFN